MLALDEVCVPQGVDDEPSRVDERNDAPKPIAMRATNAMRRFGFFCLGGTEARGVLAGVGPTVMAGCGACVAACPNASAMLFTGAKISHLGLLPQGQPERLARVVSMLNQHDAEGFGGCTNIGECAAVCPKSVPLEVISRLNRDLGHALWKGQHAH